MQYSIVADVTSGTVNAEKLRQEIVAAQCVQGAPRLIIIGDTIEIANEVLDQTALNTIIHDHVALSLSDLKATKVLDIDARTREIIAGGFAFDGQTFSLSEQAQMNWLGLITLQDMATWPKEVTTNADTAYSLTLGNLPTFIGAGMAVIDGAVAAGRTLKIAANAATTQAELDAVVDTR